MTGAILTGTTGVSSVLAANDDIGKAGPFGLFLIVSLLVAVLFLGRSMRTHLRRVPLEFPEPDPSADRPTDAIAGDEGVLETEIVDDWPRSAPPTDGRRRPGKPRSSSA